MGRKSTKENKNIYQLAREDCGYTRSEAEDRLAGISADKISRIENGGTVTADDVIQLSKAYARPELCNYYCTHECRIGKEKIPVLEIKELSQIVVETVVSINKLNANRDRLLDITADNAITEEEYKDFAVIANELDNISLSVENLKLWLEKSIFDGKIDRNKLNEIRKNLK